MNQAVIVNPDWTAGLPNAPGLVDAVLPMPTLGAQDVLVEVRAVALNPIDLKMMKATPPPGASRVLGWDAAGVVVDTGPEVTRVRPGDAVYYVGSITRPGCFSRFQAVDARLVGHMPTSIDVAAAAALPMGSLVSWEALFERLALPLMPAQPQKDTLLIVGAAGGVGTMAMQLAARLAGQTVIATASRSASADHCRAHGASHVVDHRQPLRAQLSAIDVKTVSRILCLADPSGLMDTFADIIAPFGAICCLADASGPLAVNALRNKSAAFLWEGVFTRSLYRTRDMDTQSAILDQVAAHVDQGVLRSPLTVTRQGITAADLLESYKIIESGTSIGKVVHVR